MCLAHRTATNRRQRGFSRVGWFVVVMTTPLASAVLAPVATATGVSGVACVIDDRGCTDVTANTFFTFTCQGHIWTFHASWQSGAGKMRVYVTCKYNGSNIGCDFSGTGPYSNVCKSEVADSGDGMGECYSYWIETSASNPPSGEAASCEDPGPPVLR